MLTELEPFDVSACFEIVTSEGKKLFVCGETVLGTEKKSFYPINFLVATQSGKIILSVFGEETISNLVSMFG